MESTKLYPSLCVFSAVAFVFFLAATAVAKENSELSDPAADLRLTVGLYQEGGRYTLPFTKTSTAKRAMKSAEQWFAHEKKNGHLTTPASSSLRVVKNYSVLASASYVIRTRRLGNFGIGMGYSYRVDYLHMDMLKGIKNKVMRDALPYGQLFWEKTGILLLRGLSLGTGARLWVRSNKDGGYPLHLSCNVKYRVGGMTSVYAGLHIPTDFPSFKLESKGKSRILPVIGIEFST